MRSVCTPASYLQVEIVRPALIGMTDAIAAAHEHGAAALTDYLLASKIQLARLAHGNGRTVYVLVSHV
jgi:hypothetical protein